MQWIGISPHLLLSTQIEGNLVWIHHIGAKSSWTSSCLWHLVGFYICARCSTYHWVTWWPYSTFQTIQTCSSEGHKGTISVVWCYISCTYYCWFYNLFPAFCGHRNVTVLFWELLFTVDAHAYNLWRTFCMAWAADPFSAWKQKAWACDETLKKDIKIFLSC